MSNHRTIEKVAFDLYEKSGKIHGHDVDHWLEAERLVAARQATQKGGSAPAEGSQSARAGKSARRPTGTKRA